MAKVYDCPSAQNCSYTCGTDGCQNLTINCPTASGYSCELTCAANLACLNVTINAGPLVSKLALNTVDNVQTNSVRVNSQAQVVNINCAGGACFMLDLRITNATQVSIICDPGKYGSSCVDNTWMVTFSETLDVACRGGFACMNNGVYFNTISKLTFTCQTEYSCTDNTVSFNSGTQLSVTCSQENSCSSNTWLTNRDDNVVLNFPSLYSAQEETWNITKAVSLTMMAADEGMQGIVFTLEDITTFLLHVSGFGRIPGSKWNRINVQQVYLQETGAKSFWLNGSESSPIVCDNNKPCYIRSDINRENIPELQVVCPQDLSGQGGDVCRIYCAGDSNSCNNMMVKAYQSSSVILSSVTSSGFLLNMNSTEVKNTSQLQLSCVDEGCLDAHFVIAGAKDISVNCTGDNGCNGVNLQASYVGEKVQILCDGFDSCNSAAFHIIGSNLLETTVLVESTYPTRQSLWNFENLKLVTFNCLGGGACFNTTVNGYFVQEMRMVCDGATGLACEYTILNITSFSNTTLTCTQNGCAKSHVYCPEPMPATDSCNVNCLLGNQLTSSFASCDTINIYTASNYAYGNSVNLTCQKMDGVESCTDVTIHCGEKYLCNCPVTLEQDEKTWYCDGQCGTEECVESSGGGGSSSKTSSGVIAAAVIIPLIVIFVLIGGGWWWCRRRQQEEVSLLKPKEESLNTASAKYETY